MRKGKVLVILALAASMIFYGGCGKEAEKAEPAQPVKAMKVLVQDTAVHTEYAGQLKGKDEIQVKPKVSGTIVEKYVKGGDIVSKGTPLYRIDSRQYRSEVLAAEAAVEKAKIDLNNAETDLGRYEQLASAGAISEQRLTTQNAAVDSYRSICKTQAAALQKARENLDDTVIYAPVDGKLSLDEAAEGVYAVAGTTTLVTMGTINPIYDEFSISETEYMALTREDSGESSLEAELTMSDGSVYPLKSRTFVVDRAISGNTGTLTMKALFDNPESRLLPGMFTRIRLSGTVIPHAVLVPVRAVQQILDKSCVYVTGSDKKAHQELVELGPQIGSYVVVEKGLSPDDTVLVEGIANMADGMPISVTLSSPEELHLTLEDGKESGEENHG